MAAGCVFHRTLVRTRSGPDPGPNQAQVVCREQLVVLDVERYTRDQSSALCFPQNVFHSPDLYDLTLFDGDCRLRVSLDPSLNHLLEKRLLRRGSVLRGATFRTCLALQLPESSTAQDTDHAPHTDSFSLVSLEVCGLQRAPDPGPWSWFGSSPGSDAHVLPLRAKRSVFLSLWNNSDPHGNGWRPEEEEEEEEEERGGLVASVTVAELKRRFSSFSGGTSQKQLIVRVVHKSALMYYGRAETNCTCPFKAVLEVCDGSGDVGVVLWNSVCLDWYCRLAPGDIISLRRFRVKPRYQGEHQDDIEISVNSRNPACLIRKFPESSLSPKLRPPEPAYSFCSSAELRDRPHGEVCDVIGLVTFSGRSERLRSKDSQGAELFSQYRWLRLEDGSCGRPIAVKLFATSQPEVHKQLLPMSVVVCTRLKLVRSLDQAQFYLTNTSFSQVYCTGLGHHSRMSYRRLTPVRRFLKWLRAQDDGQVLGRALVGGFFVFPPPPVTMETFMKSRRVAPSVLQGAELLGELDRLCYRERRSFCFQATVSAVTHCRQEQSDQCLSWSLAPPTPFATPLSSPLIGSTPYAGQSPRSVQSPSSSSSSPALRPGPRLLDRAPSSSRSTKRRLFHAPSTNKRSPPAALRPEPSRDSVVLFEASLEFLQDSEDSEEDSAPSSYITAASTLEPIATETLPVRYDPAQKEALSIALTMGAGVADGAHGFQFAFEDYYSLRLQVLSGLSLDVLFLPDLAPAPACHSNSWVSILAHGAFSPHGPPPAPADLVATAAQLSNRRLLCVLEACRLGGDKVELVLSRAFVLN
ncbi:RPA-related protein RADX [Eucyclogobius newberryi]|uniref:RPA-related protein RADX n=1 Tax=Eucyclogobius newberryi TaxID=166745 RepID=UPI003B5AC2DE